MRPSYPILSGSSAAFGLNRGRDVEFLGPSAPASRTAADFTACAPPESPGAAAETRPDVGAACTRRGWLHPSRWPLRFRHRAPETRTACTRLAPGFPSRLAKAPSGVAELVPARR